MTARHKTVPTAALPVLLAALSAIGPFSIDAYLPAFPAIETALEATPVQVQQTLTAFLATFTLMMLWHGTLSDALGRRRVILVTLALYVASSALCIFATRIEHLWLGRALQGATAGAGMVVGRAMIRDFFTGAAAQRLMSHVSMMFAIAPAIAPIIGGFMQHYFGWNGIFGFLVLFGSLLWLTCWRWLPESLPEERRQTLHPMSLLRSYRSVVSNGAFVRLAFALSLNFTGFFIYVLSAPVFLIRHLGVSPQGFAWLFLPMVVGMIAGSYASGYLAGRVSQVRTIAFGYVLMLSAASVNIALNLFWPPALPWAVLPMPLYVFGLALTMPSLQLIALDIFPEKRGLAASCQSTLQNGTNTLCAAFVVPLLWDSTLLLAWGMAAFLLLGLASFALWLWQNRSPSPTA